MLPWFSGAAACGASGVAGSGRPVVSAEDAEGAAAPVFGAPERSFFASLCPSPTLVGITRRLPDNWGGAGQRRRRTRGGEPDLVGPPGDEFRDEQRGPRAARERRGQCAGRVERARLAGVASAEGRDAARAAADGRVPLAAGWFGRRRGDG